MDGCLEPLFNVEAAIDMETSDWQQRFEDSWTAREEKLYPALFGSLGAGIYPLDAELFRRQFHQDSIDPRWLHYGVFESPPTNARPNWLYVSSGLSNAWEAESADPANWSGLGCEFILQCMDQSRWGLLLLRSMVAFQILLSCGQFAGKAALAVWDRIPLKAPIDGVASKLDWVLLAPATDFAESQQLASGRFRLLQFVGITADEADYARAEGGDKLLDLLVMHRAAPVTNPHRSSIFPGAPQR